MNLLIQTGIIIALITLPTTITGVSIQRNRSVSSKLDPLIWTPNNHKFTPSDANKYLQMTGQIGDSIDLVCPKSTDSLDDLNYLTIYKVGSQHEFDNCIINPNNRQTVPILRCDKPEVAVKFTLFFIKFSPVPFALEFEEGKEYFFLTTSSGERKGLNYMTGGLCNKFNMKFSIKIGVNEPVVKATTKVTSTLSQKLMSEVKSGETRLPSKMNLVSKSPGERGGFNLMVLVICLSVLIVTTEFV